MTNVPHRLMPPFALALALALAACAGAPAVPRSESLAELRQAIEAPVDNQEESSRRSRLVEQIVEDQVLNGMRRFELEEAIGRGDACSRHPRCQPNGFEQDDWFYTVGALGAGFPGPVPLLIVGFNREGKVMSVWNLRTHEE